MFFNYLVVCHLFSLPKTHSSEQDVWSVEKTSCPTKHLTCSPCATLWQGVMMWPSKRSQGLLKERGRKPSQQARLHSLPWCYQEDTLHSKHPEPDRAVWEDFIIEREVTGCMCLWRHWLTAPFLYKMEQLLEQRFTVLCMHLLGMKRHNTSGLIASG